MSQKSKKKAEQSLISNHDQERANISPRKPNQTDPTQNYPPLPYAENYWGNPSQPYLYPEAMDPMSYNQYPPMAFSYPMAQPGQPPYPPNYPPSAIPMPTDFGNKLPLKLPRAPQGRNLMEPVASPWSSTFVNQIPGPMPPVIAQPPLIVPPVPAQPVVPVVSQPPAALSNLSPLQQPVFSTVPQQPIPTGFPPPYGQPMNYPYAPYPPHYPSLPHGYYDRGHLPT